MVFEFLAVVLILCQLLNPGFDSFFVCVFLTLLFQRLVYLFLYDVATDSCKRRLNVATLKNLL